MRTLYRIIFVLLISAKIAAQIPAPQINLTGNLGCEGFPCLNNGTLILSSDADHTMTAKETSAMYIKVTSSVSLTATRNIIAPSGNFPFTIENATTGGQSIQIIGPTGNGVIIPNGSTVAVWYDGSNFVETSPPALGSTLPVIPSACDNFTLWSANVKFLTPQMCGAVADGTTDDTEAFQLAATTAITNGFALYLPGDSNYRVTKSIDATCQVGQTRVIYGDGQNAGSGNGVSIITHALTEAYPVLDIGGCWGAVLRDFSMIPPSYNPANSQATAGILLSNGNNGYGSLGGQLSKIENVNICAGQTATSSDLVLLNVDLTLVSNSNLGCVGDGGGLVAGQGLGKATSVASKFYTLAGGTNPTVLSFTNNSIAGDKAPPMQLTGSGEYILNGGYARLVGGGTGANVIEMSITGAGGGSLENALFGAGLRTENQSSRAGSVALMFDEGTWGSNISLSLNDVSAGAVAFKGASSLVGIDSSHFTFAGQVTTVFNFPGNLYGVSFDLGQGNSTFGSIGTFSGGDIYDAGSTTATIEAGITYLGPARIIGTNGNTVYNNLTASNPILSGTITNSTWSGGSGGVLTTNTSGQFGYSQYLPVALGGTGTATPSLVSGTNVTISGSWPNQTVSSTSGPNVQVGQVTSSSGTVTTAHTFSTAFPATPNCVASPLSNAGAWYFSTVPTTSSTGIITYATSGAQTFNVQCTGPGGVW